MSFASQYILTRGSVWSFPHHLSIPGDVSVNTSLYGRYYLVKINTSQVFHEGMSDTGRPVLMLEKMCQYITRPLQS